MSANYRARRLACWRGQEGWHRDMVDAVARAGFATELFSASTLKHDTWAVVIQVPGTEAPHSEIYGVIETALDVGVNVIVLRPEFGPSPTPDAFAGLRSRFRKGSIAFADEVDPRRPDAKQDPVTLGMLGGEVRQVAPTAEDFLRSLESPARPLPFGNPSLEVDGDIPGADVVDLLRHCFDDAVRLRLRRLHGGRASEAVLAVKIERGAAHDRPLPYVAKIANRAAIIAELRAFQLRVRDFVPFANRPNFLVERSIVLAHRGVLVGQFAERASPLDDVVRREGGTAAVDELFSSVLERCWANSARSADAIIRTSLQATNIAQWCELHRYGDQRLATVRERFARANTTFQVVLPPSDLASRFLSETVELRHGRIHGDLNYGNILVRDQSPVLIDFSNWSDGPLLADPAWLEVKLYFDWDSGTGPDAAQRQERWRQGVAELYDKAVVGRPYFSFVGDDDDDELYRLFACVRAIRRHGIAAAVTGTDYILLLGAALMRFASYRSAFEDDNPETALKRERAEVRAACAYAAAVRLSESLTTRVG
jgi:hypothetical protein